jgi:hypothetical protein
MTKNKVFPLSNLVLYAKDWYKKSDNVWDDLKKILELDDYTPFTNGDVYRIITGQFSKFDVQQSELTEVLFGIHPNECWKVGYYVKGCNWVNNSEQLPEYDMPTAFIHYVLSTLRFLDNEQWKVATPKYKKYPKNPDIPTKRVIEYFNGRKKELV